MDPNATLIRLLEAIEARDYGDAKEALDTIQHWMFNGGFAPNCTAAIETLRERMRDT